MKPIVLKGRIPSKKNNRDIFKSRGKIVNRPGIKYRSWNRIARLEVMSQIAKKKFDNISSVKIVFWFPDNIKKDLTNAAESIMDLLVDCGTIKDDCWQIIPEIILRCEGIDRKNPRAEIWILQ